MKKKDSLAERGETSQKASSLNGPRRKQGNRWRRNRQRRRSSSEYPKCPFCEQKIRDLLTAIAVTEANVPAHFDCTVKDISHSEVFQHREKVVYLGKGEFGIVKFRGGNSQKFTIRKRIAYEQENANIPWRKEISNQLEQ